MKSRSHLRAVHSNGILTPPQLEGLADYCLALGKTSLRLGCHNDIYLDLNEGQSGSLTEALAGWGFSTAPNRHSLVNSLGAQGLQGQTSWLTEGSWLDALNSFPGGNRLPVFLTDPQQNFWPRLQTGLNFLASPHPDFWYLLLQFPHFPEPWQWPCLIDSAWLGRLTFLLEDEWLLLETRDLPTLFDRVANRFTGLWRLEKAPLVLPEVPPFYGEGLLRDRRGTTCLGVLGQQGRFGLEFLREAARLVRSKGNGRIFLTPWQSLLVKDIKEQDRPAWETLCGQFGLNLRHASQYFGWLVPPLDEALTDIQHALIDELVARDTRTFGLRCQLDWQTSRTPSAHHPAAQVILKVRSGWWGWRFDLWADLTPNLRPRPVLTEANLSLKQVPEALARLNQDFYQARMPASQPSPPAPPPNTPEAWPLYSCRHCLTVYDQSLGLPRQGIPAGTPFSALPAAFTCEVCEAPKTDFQLLVR